MGQGAQFVHWHGAEADLIWTNTSRDALALYDGHGRRDKELPALQAVFGERPRRDVQASVVRLGTDPRDLMCLKVDGKMHLFAPEARDRGWIEGQVGSAHHCGYCNQLDGRGGGEHEDDDAGHGVSCPR